MRARTRKKAVRLSLPFVIIFVLSIMAVFTVSANYQELYNKPHVTNAVMDCAGFDRIAEQIIANPMSGEWEFFYGKWIVSDNESYAPDAMIGLPARWTGKKIDDKRLPKTGYASYRMKIVNLENVEKIRVYVNRCTLSYRVFINGKLVVTEGIISKNISETFATASKTTVEWYYPQANEELTIVIEVSNNNQGGLYLTPWFDVTESDATSLSNFITDLPKILFGGMIVLVLFCLIVPVHLSHYENRFSFPMFLAAIILHFFTTKDMSLQVFNLIGLNYALAPVLRYLTGAILLLCFLYHLLRLKVVKSGKTEMLVFLSVNAAAFILYFLLAASAWQIASIAVSLSAMLYVYYKIALCAEKQPAILVYLFINFILLSVLSLEAVDSLGFLVFGLEAAFSIGLCVLIAASGLMHFYKMRESQQKVVLAASYEKEIAIMKMQTLRAQIKPHFIFNSLSAIQDIYRNSPVEGEEMLSRFAVYLRTNVELDKTDLIPFEEELGNVLNYFELENLRYEGKLTLLLNIDFSNFSLPPLSLQPLIENAIKHGNIHEKEDGKIELSVNIAEDGSIVVDVSDNGCGFDSEPAPKSVGLKNVTERLKYALNASVTVKSMLGSGTSVVIIIPKKEERNENYCS